MTGSSGTLIRGRHVLTAADPAVVVDGAVRVLGDRIEEVGSFDDLSARYPDDQVFGGPNDLVTPGFINTHGHFSEALITGIAKDRTLWEWIAALIGPMAPHLDAEAAFVGTLLGGIQMLQSGVTLANDMFVCDPRPDGPTTPGVVRALDEIGMRGIVSFGAADIRGAGIKEILAEHDALASAAEDSSLSTFRVGIAALGAQSDELYAESLRYAAGSGVHIHLQEVREEVTQVRLRHGVTPIEHCARTGLFESPTIAAHCVWVDQADRRILAEHRVGVAHNPVSNMILASGVAPVPELIQEGVSVGIGVDGAASNDRQDMIEAMKAASLLQRVHRLQATSLSGKDVFEMATIGGARALGVDEQLGSLEPGKLADIVSFDGDSLALANVHDPFGSVAFVAGASEVDRVWIGGEMVLAGHEPVRVDPLELAQRSRALSASLLEKAGIR